MIQINIGDHVSTVSDFHPFPARHRQTMRWARERCFWIARNLPEANRYFARLPYQLNLSALLADRTIWLNHENNPDAYGTTEPMLRREVGISSTAFAKGRWVVLATVVHELAHVGGAPGFSHAAEQAVLACGLGRRSELLRGRDDPRTPYEPGITG